MSAALNPYLKDGYNYTKSDHVTNAANSAMTEEAPPSKWSQGASAMTQPKILTFDQGESPRQSTPVSLREKDCAVTEGRFDQYEFDGQA